MRLRLVRPLALVLGLASAAAVTTAMPRPAHAVIVERIVAVVGDRPILLSELRHRARPQLTLVARQTGGDPTQMAAAEPSIMRTVLDQMIDERLIEQQADKAHISVKMAELDRALETKAQQVGITEKQLLEQARMQGFSEQDYRDEVRRQLLEGKLLQLRVAGRVRITEQDARAAYAKLVKQIGSEAPVDLQVIAMKLPTSAAGIDAKEKLAQDIVMRARRGEDFCKLVKEDSDDTATLDNCGSRGAQPMSRILPAARQMLQHMKEGDISDPIRIGDQAIVVFRLAKRQPIPPYEKVREQMYDQATEEAIMQQRTVWVKELRRAAVIDVRL